MAEHVTSCCWECRHGGHFCPTCEAQVTHGHAHPQTDAPIPHPMVEVVALAMAVAEGNADAQERATRNNYDALGYTALAAAALAELDRLGVLAGTPATDTTTGAVGAP